MKSRSDFCGRMQAVSRAIESEAVQAKDLSPSVENEVSRVLRSGLAVMQFLAVEDCIKCRTSEIMTSLGDSGVAFEALPSKIQEAATISAISALKYQLGLRRGADEKMSYIQSQARKIASTARDEYELTEHAFAHDKANVGESVVRDILKAFNVVNPWGEISAIGSRLGMVAMNLKEPFENAMTRRHQGAHSTHADIPQSDISQFVVEGAAIAIGFDCLLSRARREIQAGNNRFLAGEKKIREEVCRIRVIRRVGQRWKEYAPKSFKAFRVSKKKEEVISGAQSRALKRGEGVVVFDDSGIHVTWWMFP